MLDLTRRRWKNMSLADGRPDVGSLISLQGRLTSICRAVFVLSTPDVQLMTWPFDRPPRYHPSPAGSVAYQGVLIQSSLVAYNESRGQCIRRNKLFTDMPLSLLLLLLLLARPHCRGGGGVGYSIPTPCRVKSTIFWVHASRQNLMTILWVTGRVIKRHSQCSAKLRKSTWGMSSSSVPVECMISTAGL